MLLRPFLIQYTVTENGYTPLDFLIYVLVCTAQTIKSMKTNDIPLKSPKKLQQQMQKKF